MKSKILAVLSVATITAASLISTTASGDTLDRGTVEQKLRSDFGTAEQIQLTSLKENYWGLYKNYQVSFNAKFSEGTYNVSCNVIERSVKDLRLNDCAATDTSGTRVDIAKYYGKDALRIPAAAH
jgi:hypothetical protein